MYKSTNSGDPANRSRKCQKCLETTHWTYECKGQQKTLISESKTRILKKRVIEDEKGSLKVIVPPEIQARLDATSSNKDCSSDSEYERKRRKRKRKKMKKKHKKSKKSDTKDSSSDGET